MSLEEEEDDDEELPSRRSAARFLTDLDLTLFDSSGRLIDAHAQAHDVSPKGFRAETKTNLAEGDVVRFSLDFEEEEPVTGQAQVVWIGQNPWGWYNVGVKITRISWRDSRRLQSNLFKPGYDFASLAKKAMRALWWLVLIAGVDNIFFHQPAVRVIFLHLSPVLVALFFFGWGLMMLLGKG
ncbi:MAG: PilZ domain-containing protein [Elusimicrobia bacterium]|nr:PilZ domain-containing protein [Elusimicrobiota bacterium]